MQRQVAMLTREPELRFHHLLCLPLFQGKGYSDGFSVNMQSVKDRLESEDTAVCVQRRYDMSALPKQDGGRLFA